MTEDPMTEDPKLPESVREWLCDCGAGPQLLRLDPMPEVADRHFWRCGGCGKATEIPVYGN
jgi:hypothetical protein